MDDGAKVETYKQLLRVRYRTASAAPDLVGLRRCIDQLAAEAESSVAFTSMSFEGGQSSGTLVLEPMTKLQAALAVLAEVDPTATPAQRPSHAYVRFSAPPCA